MATQQIQIFDTTLRDGEQVPGCKLNRDEKLLIARQLEALVVAVEVGGKIRVRVALAVVAEEMIEAELQRTAQLIGSASSSPRHSMAEILPCLGASMTMQTWALAPPANCSGSGW